MGWGDKGILIRLGTLLVLPKPQTRTRGEHIKRREVSGMASLFDNQQSKTRTYLLHSHTYTDNYRHVCRRCQLPSYLLLVLQEGVQEAREGGVVMGA